MRKTIFVLALICCFPLFSNAQLTHVQGVNAIGIRGGTGVKGTMNFGLTYNYYVARTLSISAELDYERGKIDNSLFQGYLLSPGVEWSVWNPAKWFYLNLTGGLSAGYDIWKDPTVDAKFQGFTFGGNLGLPSLRLWPPAEGDGSEAPQVQRTPIPKSPRAD